jgi:wobble nucleotide-excising tRNase
LLRYTNNPHNYDVISLELNSLLVELKKLNSLNRFDSIDILSTPLDYNLINQYLEKNIVEPELNERESAILSAIKEDNGQFTNESRKFMKTQTKDSCPFCYQSVSIEHKHTVLDVIKKIMHTNDANEHVNELQAIKLSHLTLDLTAYNTLFDTKLLDSIKSTVDSYNNSLTKIEHLISLKKNNPYTPLNNTINPVVHLIILNELVSNCNSIIETFNTTLLNKKQIIQKLSELNLDLAFKDVKELLNQYNRKNNDEKMLTDNIELLESELVQLNIDLQIHESKFANIDIACDVINSYLKYIFYDNNRLTLHPNEGFYLVKCRGENTKLSSLSIGERNAIALCYFFSQLFKWKTIQEIFNSKSLLVIDDPISSFDFENKVGVYSFLRFILNELHSSNAHSKAIIFTHDLEAFQHFLKIYNDLGYKDKIATNQILNRSLKPIESEKFNEYSILLQYIFDYATDNEREKLEVTIGNTMRRVLEAFSTFNYKMGIEELTTNDDVLSFLPSEEQRNYYKNCMYRLVLHSESHFSERTKGLIDRGFVENFSTDEKVKTAKDIIILLYSLNPFHVEIHLKKDNNVLQQISKIELIERWRQEIFPQLQTVV